MIILHIITGVFLKYVGRRTLLIVSELVVSPETVGKSEKEWLRAEI